MTYHNYISLYLFFIFAFNLFLEINSFIPTQRAYHCSVLVEDKLYFLGGIMDNAAYSKEVFYLDVSQPFNIASPPWNDLKSSEMLNEISFATASFVSANNEQNIYLFGGINRPTAGNQLPKSLVYRLNLKTGRWDVPVAKGKAPDSRRQMNTVSDNSGKVYIFGGDTGIPGQTTYQFFNDMFIFNAVELSWINGGLLPNAPTPRASYTATLLSNGVIVYIGGYGLIENTVNEVVADISEINLYDTKSLTWSVQRAKVTGQIESRHSHTAVLAPNDKNKIIIYGGAKVIGNNVNPLVTPDVAVLNTETFEWTIPLISGSAPPPLKCHSADLVGNYMIVAFGNITRQNADPLTMNPNIYIMDTRNYTWVMTFEPENLVKPEPSTKSPTSPTPSVKDTNTSEKQLDVNNQLTTIKIIVGIIGGIIGIAVLVTIGIFGYKWNQRHHRENQDEIMRIHGNHREKQDGIMRISGNV